MRKLTAGEIRMLQAMRPGLVSSDQFEGNAIVSARFHCASLAKLGLVQKVRGGYQITDSGMAACPVRNPASLKPRTHPRMGPDVRGPTGHAPAREHIRHDTE